jgi:hypothetical protein
MKIAPDAARCHVGAWGVPLGAEGNDSKCGGDLAHNCDRREANALISTLLAQLFVAMECSDRGRLERAHEIRYSFVLHEHNHDHRFFIWRKLEKIYLYISSSNNSGCSRHRRINYYVTVC